MSEFAGPETWRYWDQDSPVNLHSVGKPLKDTHLIIHNPDRYGEGEICYRGRNCFMGYYKNENETIQAIDERGFLHSGDLGMFDENNNLLITWRIKELIITAAGENIAPVPIEEKIKQSLPFVSNVVVIGDRQKYLVALITLKNVTRKRRGTQVFRSFGFKE